jgi:hypothetical protein
MPVRSAWGQECFPEMEGIVDWNRIEGRRVEPGVDASRGRREVNGDRSLEENGSWWTQASLALVSAAVVVVASGCSPNPFAAAAATSERAYSVTPDSIRVKRGTVVADIVRMKVTERIEDRSGRITSPARLSGRLYLENVSADQAIRLAGGRIVYLDADGRAIPLENGRAEPIIRFTRSDHGVGRLEPGKVATELLYAEFPVKALRAGRLKTIQIKLAFSSISGVTGTQDLNFAVSIGAS